MNQGDIKTTTIVLADHHAIVREGIAAVCSAGTNLKIVAQCADGEEAINAILALQPDFAVIDAHIPVTPCLQVIRRLRDAKSGTRILVLSATRDEQLIREAFRLGADGYLLKEGPARHLLDAIGYVNDGGQYLTPLIRRDQIGGNGPAVGLLDGLSKREKEVFSALVEGIRPKDIAKALKLSPKTVDTYRAGVMRKLGVHSIAGLVRLAIERNIDASAGTEAC